MNESQKKLPGEPGSDDMLIIMHATIAALEAAKIAAVAIGRLLNVIFLVTAFNFALVVYVVWFR